MRKVNIEGTASQNFPAFWMHQYSTGSTNEVNQEFHFFSFLMASDGKDFWRSKFVLTCWIIKWSQKLLANASVKLECLFHVNRESYFELLSWGMGEEKVDR